jgi:peptidoglycan/xylan/chitin deacetylase (PgdA/CDA1 family)
MFRDTLLKTAVDVLDISGFARLLAPFYGGKGAILGLHRVLPDGATTLIPGNAVSVSQLRDVLQFLRHRKLDIVPLSEVQTRLDAHSSRRFVAITLDDGYRDNLEWGASVFREFDAPFAVFPCTGFVNRANISWDYLLEALCLKSDRVVLRHPQKGNVEFVRSQEEDKLVFFRRIQLPGWREADRQAGVEAAIEDAGMSLEEIKDQLFLSWDQLKSLAQDSLVTIGVHTVTHAALAELPLEEAGKEIGAAREELEQRLGTPIKHIAYPYGSPEACGPREFQMAQQMGFTLGLTTKRGNVQAVHQNARWSLPRHTLSMTPHGGSTRYLRISLNGIWDTPLNGTVFTR